MVGVQDIGGVTTVFGEFDLGWSRRLSAGRMLSVLKALYATLHPGVAKKHLP
jgi:hypothetical protein